jgi:hypothetical protein
MCTGPLTTSLLLLLLYQGISARQVFLDEWVGEVRNALCLLPLAHSLILIWSHGVDELYEKARQQCRRCRTSETGSRRAFPSLRLACCRNEPTFQLQQALSLYHSSTTCAALPGEHAAARIHTHLASVSRRPKQKSSSLLGARDLPSRVRESCAPLSITRLVGKRRVMRRRPGDGITLHASPACISARSALLALFLPVTNLPMTTGR